MDGVDLVFLGTGGGRFATITQKRRTGGIRLISDVFNIHVDPGPGALVYSLNSGLDPQKITAVLVSHAHPDHYTDAEVFVEAMTHGMTKKRGTLIAAHSVLVGNGTCGSSISKYHQQMPMKVIDAKPGLTFSLEDAKFLVTKTKHTDPDAIGFRLETRNLGEIAYTSDTEFFEGIGKQYQGVRLLILCILRPSGNPWKGHMTTEDAVKIVEEARPEMALLTHFGMQMIFKGPEKEAKIIQEKTGIPTVATNDGMRVSLQTDIQIHSARERDAELGRFTKTKIE
jgi:phosphoribosyl 1,2-cyclic phosphodiesterase